MISLVLLPLLFTLVVSDCPDGFMHHDDSCYVLMRVKASWAEANGYCKSVDTKLVQVETESENNFLTSWLRTESGSMGEVDGVWMGGHDLTMEGVYHWAGSVVRIRHFWWDEGEPNDNGDQDCMTFWKEDDFLWGDDQCNHQKYFICERDEYSESFIVST